MPLDASWDAVDKLSCLVEDEAAGVAEAECAGGGRREKHA